MELRDKVAIVTGGTSGIGRAIATRFVAAGARVVVVGTSDEAGRSLEATLRAAARERGAGDCLFVRADVSRADEVSSMVQTVIARWDAIDVVVNNAAIMKGGRLMDTDEADWDRTMAVNVKGAFLVCKCALPHMPPKAAIVMVSSVHAVATDAGSAAYTASKGALEALTRALALECFEQQIRVNAIRPGAIDTPMLWSNPNVQAGREKIHPLEVGGADEIADAVLFLASERASFVSGAVLTADGGRLPLLASHAK